MVKLSILIPVYQKHIEKFYGLFRSLASQLDFLNDESVEILNIKNNGESSIGFYRQSLLEMSKADYVVFIDADDKVSNDYVQLVLKALESNPDCLGLKGTMTTNGQKHETWEISKNLPYDQQRKQKGIFHYRRFTNHLAPIKRSIALQIGYKPIGFGEDYDYAKRLHDSKLCKTEVKINKEIYHYDFWTNK
jgi:glycosyltransferase involved in cell wall biosynthesis